MQRGKFHTPPEIRILPMDKKSEFKGKPIREVQKEFFFNSLPTERKMGNRYGKFLFKTSGMKTEKGSVVLFQYDNKIIAKAKLADIVKFPNPLIGDPDEPGLEKEVYNGAYFFEPSSISIFDPITKDEIKKIWPQFKKFSNTKHKLEPPERYSKLRALLKDKFEISYPKFEESIFLKKYGSGGEGSEHKHLKEWIAQNPQFLGINNPRVTKPEHRFLSGDAVDILFELSDGTDIVVEIETGMPMPGCHQIIKYRALRCAEKGYDLMSSKVRGVIVAWIIPDDVRKFCDKYNIKCSEKKL